MASSTIVQAKEGSKGESELHFLLALDKQYSAS